MSLNANQFDTGETDNAENTPSPQQQDDFTSILANSVHDMKNSVNMLLGALDDISGRCGGSSCPSHELLSQLRYEGKRLNSNLVQMLMLYRVNNSQYTLNIEENDAYEVLEECYLENEGILSLKGITIELACPEGLMGFFDRELVTGIINSVINNAYKYAKDKIRIGATRQNGYLSLFVEENGNGYPDFMLSGDAGADHRVNFKTGSTGLGLLFTSTIARMHSHQDKTGYITTTNEGIDGGGRFTLHLP
jgi:signal transduction histidine kinase